MRKSELIALLSDPDLPDVDVLLSSDGEGNSFRFVDEVSLEDEEDSDLFDQAGGPVLIIWPVY